jgi:hypothetical protein
MEFTADLDENPGKVVGKVKQRPPGDTLERMVARFHAMGLTLPFPKGVYRFKTFEEADAWEMKHRIAAAVKRLRDHQR